MYGRRVKKVENLYEIPVKSEEFGTYMGEVSDKNTLVIDAKSIIGKGIKFFIGNKIGVTTMLDSYKL